MSKQSDLVKLLQTDSALAVPTGTTAQRPASPAVGDVRYNTTEGEYEAYNGLGWVTWNTLGYSYTVDILVVAGGGGGGDDWGGGGGA